MRRRSDGREGETAPHIPASPEDAAARRMKSRRSVITYVVTLFLVAMLFTILSYFVQARHSREVTELTQKSVSAMAKSADLQKENESLRKDVDDLITERNDLVKELDQLKEKLQATEAEKNALAQATQEMEQELARLVEKYNELARQFGYKEYQHD
ncbi:MAG TPA: hypothetical protein GXZ77_02400 [Papillibacter sp.]|nr:hypothetical protein [Papillibacter sp.]